MKMTNLEELFIDQLQDRYSAAQQQQKAFVKLEAACAHAELKEILTDDIAANKNHMAKLKEILNGFNANPEGEYCEGTAGLVKEAIDTLHLFDNDKLLDIAIVISVQHINHHDIAGYHGCAMLAKKLGNTALESTLHAMYEEEKTTDVLLSAFIDKLSI